MDPVMLMQAYSILQDVCAKCQVPLASVHITFRDSAAEFIATMYGGEQQVMFSVSYIVADWQTELRASIVKELSAQLGGRAS